MRFVSLRNKEKQGTIIHYDIFYILNTQLNLGNIKPLPPANTDTSYDDDDDDEDDDDDDEMMAMMMMRMKIDYMILCGVNFYRE